MTELLTNLRDLAEIFEVLQKELKFNKSDGKITEKTKKNCQIDGKYRPTSFNKNDDNLKKRSQDAKPIAYSTGIFRNDAMNTT